MQPGNALMKRENVTPRHGLLIEYGRICHIVKLPISMISTPIFVSK